MAVRNGTTANTDTLARDSSVPSYDAAYTVLVWFQIASSPGSWNTAEIFEIGKNQWESYYFDSLGIYNVGGVLELYHRALNNATGQELLGASELSTGTWYCAALVRASDTDRKIFLGTLTGLLAEDGALTSGVGDRSANPAGWLHIDRYRAGAIRSGNAKIWTRALTLAELQAEQFRMRPAAFADLIAWLPFLDTGSSRGRDYAGNAALTTYGTMSDEDNPPVSYGAGILSVPRVSAGTAYSQSVSGAITPAGSLTRQGGKILEGAINFSGGVARQISKYVAGVITPAGVLSALRTHLINLTGSLAPAGQLTMRTSIAIAGQLSFVGSLIRKTAKTFSGSFSPAGILSAAKGVIQVSLSGTLSMSGALSRQTSKVFAGGITPAGSLAKQIGKWLHGVLAPIGALASSLVSRPTQVIMLTLPARAFALTLDSRSAAFTLMQRGATLSLDERGHAMNLMLRSTRLTLEAQ